MPSSALGRCGASCEPPSSVPTWPSAITIDDPSVKPLITGREKKFARKPMRNKPQASSTAPDSRASWPASMPYSAVPGAASGPSADAVIRAMIAIGPTDCAPLVPNSAYSSGGAMLAYRPATGGKPATSA
jgi:hypothetical protein